MAADYSWLVMLAVLFAAINYSLLSSISATAGWIGMQCGTYVIVASYFKLGLHFAVGRTEMVLLGGAILMAMHALFDWLHHLREPRVLTNKSLLPLSKRLDTRLAQLIEKLREQFRLTGPSITYTLRMAITLLLCTAIYRRFHIRNGYWCPMTALLVLKPQWSATLSRGIARFVGTVAGAGIALGLAHTVPFSTPLVFAMVVVCAWGCYAL